jgi:hypothetical protein
LEGRVAEAEVLAALALRRVGALVAITGPPASGKTALALRVVAALEEQLPATWIDVGGAWDPARAAGLSGALAAVSARGDGPALALAQRQAASGGAGLEIHGPAASAARARWPRSSAPAERAAARHWCWRPASGAGGSRRRWRRRSICGWSWEAAGGWWCRAAACAG